MAQAPESSEGGGGSSLLHLDSSASVATNFGKRDFNVRVQTVEDDTPTTLDNIWQKLYYPYFQKTDYDVLVSELVQQPAKGLTERLLFLAGRQVLVQLASYSVLVV